MIDALILFLDHDSRLMHRVYTARNFSPKLIDKVWRQYCCLLPCLQWRHNSVQRLQPSSPKTLRYVHQSAQLPLTSGSTIYALSTSPGRAAIAIIRVSGDGCEKVRGHRARHVEQFLIFGYRYTVLFALILHYRKPVMQLCVLSLIL